MSDQPIFSAIAIPIENFKSESSLDACGKHLDNRFVGRVAIIDKLVDLLQNKNRRGSYLIAGYRGAGKTSVIDKALNKYRSKEKEKTGKKQGLLEVRINLGDNSQLTPLNIYYSIASILRDKIISNCPPWEKLLKSFVAPQGIGIATFILLATVLPIAWFNPALSIDVYKFTSYLFYLFYLVIVLKGIIWALTYFSHPELKSLKKIDKLIDRISNEISESHSAGLNHHGFSFWRSKHKKSLPIAAREAEVQLFSIFEEIQGGKRNQVIACKIVIVLDEIDKLSDKEEFSEIQYHDISSVQEPDKISRINTLLGSLKNFVTTADATFFFISGRETLDRYYSEKGSSNSLYESLFDQVFEVPSFLTDQGERPRGTQLTTLIEEYVCRCIIKERVDSDYDENDPVSKEEKLDYYTLNNYRKLLLVSIGKLNLTTEEEEKEKEKISRCINTLAVFIHYLTFHSWGNPKRLSSIFASFIVLEDRINFKKDSSTLSMRKEDPIARHWLVFNANHQRSFSLASEIMTVFQHQLSREVSKISDKLTVSTLSSLHFILKLHSYGFTRESLHRMSEAINVYRSPELNTIIDDLLSHVFKSYIRRVRNGIYRYRINSGLEQELRYISHVSELESATYNFSLDAMRHVKRFFEHTLANSKETGAIARAHITLGDMCAIEQSYTVASTHYSTASHILDNVLSKSKSPVNPETLMQCIEAMVKHGDLEERRQNYHLAAAIYLEAEHIVRNLKDTDLRRNLLQGDSKWDLLKQPFWATQYLSLKRSPKPFKKLDKRFEINLFLNFKPEFHSHLYRPNDQRFYFRHAHLCFFLGDGKRAAVAYSKVVEILTEKNGTFSNPDERVGYMMGKALVGLVESTMVYQSRRLFSYQLHMTGEDETLEKKFAIRLLNLLKDFSTANENIGLKLESSAEHFEHNNLYISAAITHIKAISFYTAILDVFDYSTFQNDKINSTKLVNLTDAVFKKILKSGADAIRCIDMARQLETSQSNKTLLIYDLDFRGDAFEMTITKLFDMLTGSGVTKGYPVDEPIFWQNSLWAHKLAVTLCWAHYVKRKITTAPGKYGINPGIPPGNLPSILGMSGFSIRPAILLHWICARDLNRQYIDKKLMTINRKKSDINEILAHLDGNGKKKQALADGTDKVVNYIYLLSEKNSAITLDDMPETLKKAYLISKYLYFAQESSRIISRKNLDLIFPRLPQIYFAQWKLLLNLILAMYIGRQKNASKLPTSIRELSISLQKALMTIDKKLAPEERMAPSHFDYEFIYLRLCESLESSINLVDRNSRTHMSIFQHKYFCHDDHNDPDFRMDYTLAYMFTPRAFYLKTAVRANHERFKKILAK